MTDAEAPPEVPPEAPVLTKSQKRNRRRRENAGGNWHLSQPERKVIYARELRELNVQVPGRVATKAHVDAMRKLKSYMRETWQQMLPTMNQYKRFTALQIEFARQYALNGRTSRAKAMTAAGYKISDPENARVKAAEIMRKDGMEQLVAAFELEEKARMKIRVEDVVKWFNDIAMSAMNTGDFTNANRAMENLAKYLGMFVEKKEILHRTVHSREELDVRIGELTAILKEAEPDIERKLRIH